MKNPLFWMAMCVSLSVNAGAAARFEPPPGKILLIAGQTATDIPEYLNATEIMPAGWMAYTNIHGDGLDTPHETSGVVHHVKKLVQDYPNTTLQLGLDIVDECRPIAQGDRDKEIDHLGQWLQKTHRPVFLRIGYEFDGPHNHYPPADYVAAYRRIVDRFREKGVTNVAFVWHSFASVGSKMLMDWYPGDAYVDWVGISYFNQPTSYMLPVVEAAKRLNKPVMIAEASPVGVQTKYANAWALWFNPMLKFVRDHQIKAISMISCDWDSYPMFEKEHWGDCRLHRESPVLLPWIEEIRKDSYLKSSPDLFQILGYSK